MARIRNLKPEFWHDRKLARSCSRDARMLYMGLWNQADEWARCNGDVAVIKGQVFPYDDVDIGALLAELTAAGRVLPYEWDGDPYLLLPKLDGHQRLDRVKMRPKFPEPPDDLEQRPDDLEQGTNPQVTGVPEKSGRDPDFSRRDPDESAPDPEKSALLYGTWNMLSGTGNREEKSAPRADPAAIVAAYVDGARQAGFPDPDRSLCARVGKQAKAMLGTNDPVLLVQAARRMGSHGWHDLAVEIQRGAANARAPTPRNPTAERNGAHATLVRELEIERLERERIERKAIR